MGSSLTPGALLQERSPSNNATRRRRRRRMCVPGNFENLPLFYVCASLCWGKNLENYPSYSSAGCSFGGSFLASREMFYSSQKSENQFKLPKLILTLREEKGALLVLSGPKTSPNNSNDNSSNSRNNNTNIHSVGGSPCFSSGHVLTCVFQTTKKTTHFLSASNLLHMPHFRTYCTIRNLVERFSFTFFVDFLPRIGGFRATKSSLFISPSSCARCIGSKLFRPSSPQPLGAAHGKVDE